MHAHFNIFSGSFVFSKGLNYLLSENSILKSSTKRTRVNNLCHRVKFVEFLYSLFRISHIIKPF